MICFQNIFCDKTQNLNIDSVLPELKGKHKLTFFVGQDFYELKPLVNQSFQLKIVNQKKLIEFSPEIELKPPINLSFFLDQNQNVFRLANVLKSY